MNDIFGMLRVQFDYMDGNLSLREAVDAMLANGSECTRSEITKILRDSPRFNVIEFKVPRFEDEVQLQD